MQFRRHRLTVVVLGGVAVGAVLAIGLIVWAAPGRGSRTPDCSAEQLVLVGHSYLTSAPAPPGALVLGALHYMRNRGARCMFRMPKTVVAINAKGIHRRVDLVEPILNRIIPGRTLQSIHIAEVFASDMSVPSECKEPIREVTQVVVPIDKGYLRIHVTGLPWPYACKSPATVDVSVTGAPWS